MSPPENIRYSLKNLKPVNIAQQDICYASIFTVDQDPQPDNALCPTTRIFLLLIYYDEAMKRADTDYFIFVIIWSYRACDTHGDQENKYVLPC